MTVGHENAGVISEFGPGMSHWTVGERVGVAPMTPEGDVIGYGAWGGGYGPKLVATEANLVHLPDEISFDIGALGTAAGLSAYHSIVTLGEVAPGMRVGVIGLGGVGYMAARIAVLRGAEVFAAEVDPSSRTLADDIGLAGVGESITEFASEDLHVIADCAGFGTTTAEAVETLCQSGTLVQVGLGRTESTVNTFAIAMKELRILGSKSGTRQDLVDLYALIRGGEFEPPIARITPEQIPEVSSVYARAASSAVSLLSTTDSQAARESLRKQFYRLARNWAVPPPHAGDCVPHRFKKE